MSPTAIPSSPTGPSGLSLEKPQASFPVTYIGGPTVILEIGGLRFITDPTLDPAGGVYAVANTFYTKLYGPAISDIGHIDVVLLSHDQHHDNLDDMGREFIQTLKTTLTTEAGAKRLQGNSKGMALWESVQMTGPSGDTITITATPARHGPAGFEKFSGDVIGFLLSVQGQHPFEVYLTGDTVFFDGIVEVAHRFQPRYVFLFAGAGQPRGPFNVTMDTNDALDTAAAFPAATMIPLHYEGWSHYTQHAEAFEQAFSALGIGKQLKILTAGVKESLPLSG
jgi:L-ascorbate metabolism protein UlaG (beta-lactamase superfamily)